MTLRQQIIELLKIKPITAHSIAINLKSTEKAIELHLEHVQKTVGPGFETIPSECNDCGFKFNKRDKKTKPTKCPKCKSEYISKPMFWITK